MEYKNLKLLSNITGHQTEPLNEHANRYYDDDDNDEDVFENSRINRKHFDTHKTRIPSLSLFRFDSNTSTQFN